MRKPKRSPLQQSLRDAEKSVSGALLLYFPEADGNQKASLRQAFVAAVCVELIAADGPLTELGLRGQLSEGQAQAFQNMKGGPLNGFLDLVRAAGLSVPPGFPPQVLIWLELACRYVNSVLQREKEPPTVDWGRREIEFREQMGKWGQGARYHLGLPKGRLEIRTQGGTVAHAQVQVLGTYREQAGHYLAGWSDSSLPEVSRPLPVMGCASQLFRAEPIQALSEAQRSAWLCGVKYLIQHESDQKTLFLGVGTLESESQVDAFSEDDVSPEVLAKLQNLERSLSRRTPERIAGLFQSHSQELERRLSLFAPSSAVAMKLTKTAENLGKLGKDIKIHSLLGGKRDSLGGSEKRDLSAKIQELRSEWQS